MSFSPRLLRSQVRPRQVQPCAPRFCQRSPQFLSYFVEQLVKREETRSLHVPMRLFGLRIAIKRGGQMLIQDPDHLTEYLFREVVFWFG